MFFKLALQNLKFRPERTALTLLGVIISLFFFLFINSLVSGLHNYLFRNILDQNPLTQLIVRPQGQGKFLNAVNLLKKSEITEENISIIEKIPHITSVYRQNSLAGISSLQINLLGQWFQTDSLIFGTPLEYIKNQTINKDTWTVPENIIENETIIPAIASSDLLDLYNFSFASANNLPKLTPENLIGQELNIIVNKSTLFNFNAGPTPTFKAKVIGFSSKVKLIGLTIPSQAIDQINQKFLNINTPHYTDLIINIDSLDNLDSVQTEIKKLDLSAENSSQAIKNLNNQFLFIQIAINLINLVILIVCGLMIANTFLTRLIESTKQIGILRALGFSKQQIGHLFLLEAGIIGTISSITACILVIPATLGVNILLQNQFNDFSNKPSNFFELSPLLIIGSVLFGILFCLIFSYFPSQKAARLNPVEALSK